MKCLAAGTVLLVALATAAAAQQPLQSPLDARAPQVPRSPVFRAGASLVALNVTVTDGKHFVAGLQQGDFAVFEDGVQQQVQFFESKSVPVDLILLLDCSSSMRDKMEVVHEAALGFLGTLREGDRGAVVAFADSVNVVQSLSSDHDALDAAVRKTEAHGSTALNNALYIAMKQFGRSARQNGDVRRQAIAVLSDGEDTSSLISFDDVLAMARKSGINLYTISLQSQYAAMRRLSENGHRYFSESDYAMRTLARETGAQSFFPEFVQDLKGVYASIADELSNQYSIGYSPSNPRPDGRFRRIVVRLTSHPEFQPRARAGYTAEGIATASTSGGGWR